MAFQLDGCEASVDYEPGSDAALVRLRGEVDIASRAVVERALTGAAATAAALVVVDVTDLSFIDIAGLRSLLDAERDLLAGRRMVLRSPSRTLLRTLDAAGMRDRFVIEAETQP